MNNKYIIKVGHPLLRPGLTIETEASERYVTKVTNMLMKTVIEINNGTGGTTITGTNEGRSEIGDPNVKKYKLMEEPDPDYIAGVHRNPTIS